MKSDFVRIVVVIVALAVFGRLIGRLSAPVWRNLQSVQPALTIDDSSLHGGADAVFGMLGGFRAVTADVAWLRAHAAWEQRDFSGTGTWVRAATAIDPRPLAFWLNGARMLAYDAPAWGVTQSSEGPDSSAAAMTGPHRAMALLALAEQHHPRSAAIWIERASIEWRIFGDWEAAAESYRRAAELPQAPFFAARLHAEALRKLGRKREAWQYLVKLHPSLPRDRPEAAAAVIAARIRELESELSIPADSIYREPEELTLISK